MSISFMVVLIFIHSHQQYKTINLLGYGVSSRPILSKIRKNTPNKKWTSNITDCYLAIEKGLMTLAGKWMEPEIMLVG